MALSVRVRGERTACMPFVCSVCRVCVCLCACMFLRLYSRFLVCASETVAAFRVDDLFASERRRRIFAQRLLLLHTLICARPGAYIYVRRGTRRRRRALCEIKRRYNQHNEDGYCTDLRKGRARCQKRTPSRCCVAQLRDAFHSLGIIIIMIIVICSSTSKRLVCELYVLPSICIN